MQLASADDPEDDTFLKQFQFIPPEMKAIQGEFKDGWDVAVRYHGLKTLSVIPESEKQRLRAVATRSVLAQAQKVVGHFHRKKIVKSFPWARMPEGELDLETTLDAQLGSGRNRPSADDVWVTKREVRDIQAILMLDTSLSMAGLKHTLMAVGVATLILQLGSSNVRMVIFNSAAHRLRPAARTPFGQIEALLEEPDTGFTNMEAAMRAAMRLHSPRCRYVMITDGRPTAGQDPVTWAARLRPLDVISIGEDVTEVAQKVALAGQGKHRPVEDVYDLPKVLYELSLSWR